MSLRPARRRVWVVDDSPLDAERARRVLAGEHDVEVLLDGSTALERFSSCAAPDVMILDWIMPGVSGLEVCRFLRSEHVGAQKLGILLLTAHRHTDQIVEGLSAGANDYLAKPYEDEELRARVASLLRARALLERAEQAEAANRRLLETAPDPLLVIDARGRLSFVNDEAVIALGVAPDAVIGRSISELIPSLPVNEPELFSGESTFPIPDVAIRGRVFSPTLRVLPGGAASSTIVSLRDVTERRLLDERRLDFYSMIAHDLRTPLNAMTLRIANMLDCEDLARTPSLHEDVQKLDGRLRSLVFMINDFLELASLEDAKHRMERKEVDVVRLIADTVEDFRPLLDKKGHTFSGPSRCEGAAVLGDRRRIAQVLSNLVGNAIKFTPPGGAIAARVEVAQHHVEVSLEDTGVGVAPHVADTLFQRYRRADHSVGGTGLGLMIVREIVEAHGGEVGVESHPGRGSRFWFRLPRNRPAARSAPG
ncbi:ATP-binding protein [Sorangium cellulosum]|uniref:ATP-binding response regulator n=1 Tax=Sorangium cellulosum TaxID=56 RepID=UPI0009D77825|nr:ATP-binding protein [Sorangium cellulosum]